MRFGLARIICEIEEIHSLKCTEMSPPNLRRGKSKPDPRSRYRIHFYTITVPGDGLREDRSRTRWIATGYSCQATSPEPALTLTTVPGDCQGKDLLSLVT